MPQMSPMLWLIQLIFYLVLMLIVISLVHYSFYKKLLNIDNNKFHLLINTKKKWSFSY